MKNRTGGASFLFRVPGKIFGSKADSENLTLSRKLQTALEEPANSGVREMLLSGERIGKLMGRKSESGCH